nr:type I restriction enzyme endonuclease domain-containing protein [Cyanobacterium sp. IPPAS B-1200]OEJ77835.1 hypothetical protein A5482_15020 [Cyanobacterium sp. IPPAS B-1200]
MNQVLDMRTSTGKLTFSILRAIDKLLKAHSLMQAIALTEKIKKNASIDWNLKESVRAGMKVIVKRLLRQYGYPPDMAKLTTELVLEQA